MGEVESCHAVRLDAGEEPFGDWAREAARVKEIEEGALKLVRDIDVGELRQAAL